MSDDHSSRISTESFEQMKREQAAQERLKEIADKHAPKVIRPTQEPLYEKRG